uniref:V-set and transmembrane domain containing 1 n=1 Tax=Haemonchus placei TaxID=6290 RepID=A0A0N4VZG7_HAEPC
LGVLRVCSKRQRKGSKVDEMDTVERGEAHTVDASSMNSEFGSLPSIGEIEDEDEQKTPRMSVKVSHHFAFCLPDR